MTRFLVLQLARFGDLVQTRRLLRTLGRRARAGDGEVHLVVDHALVGLAGRLFPDVVVHGLAAHAPGGRDGRAGVEAVLAGRDVLASLAGLDFAAVYCLNFSPMAMAVAAMFPPETQRGYRLQAGQVDKDPLLRLVFRLARDRRGAGINLADIWAHLADDPVPAREVNPPAAPGGGGVGVALAGRVGRRSLPPEVLAPLVRTLFRATSGRRLLLFGTADQAPAARALLRRLDPATREACRDLTGGTDLPGLAEALTGLDTLVTPDTGIMHLAAALGVPVTAFFLSSAWCHETGPYGSGHRVWQAVTDCAPCLESALCSHDLACLAPLADPVLARLAAGSTKAAPPPWLVGYATGADALGAVCRPVVGQDPTEARRLAVRAVLAWRLGLDVPPAGGLEPELVQALTLETDWMLPPPGRAAREEW
jgi:hypothetical protein